MKTSRQFSRESTQRYVDILSDAGFKAVFGDRRNKDVLVDLRCSAHDGTVFIVEVQCYRQANFFRRCVLYAGELLPKVRALCGEVLRRGGGES